jgi:hypothetical protein
VLSRQVMLRRAAITIRNSAPIGLDAEVEDAVRAIADEPRMARNNMIRQIVKEWLEIWPGSRAPKPSIAYNRFVLPW